MNSSSSPRAWAPQLDLTTDGRARFDPSRIQEAIDRGYEAGLEAGRLDAIAQAQAHTEAELARARARVDQLLARIADEADRLSEHEIRTSIIFAERAIDAAAALAQTIIGRELSDDTQRAASAAGRVLSALDRHTDARLHLHPEDAALVAGMDLPANIVVEPDASLRPGDALAHTEDRTVDGRITAAIDRARQAMETLATGESA